MVCVSCITHVLLCTSFKTLPKLTLLYSDACKTHNFSNGFCYISCTQRRSRLRSPLVFVCVRRLGVLASVCVRLLLFACVRLRSPLACACVFVYVRCLRAFTRSPLARVCAFVCVRLSSLLACACVSCVRCNVRLCSRSSLACGCLRSPLACFVYFSSEFAKCPTAFLLYHLDSTSFSRQWQCMPAPGTDCNASPQHNAG